MRKEKKIKWSFVILIIGMIMFIGANIATLGFHKHTTTLPSFIQQLEADNYTLSCTEYNKEIVLRYNVTCESMLVSICFNDNCNTEPSIYSYIKENKECCSYSSFCYESLISAEPIEVEIDTDCNTWAIKKLSGYGITDTGIIFRYD